MDKSKKLVSIFLSSALVLGISGCNDEPRYQTVYDENGNPVQVIEEDDDDHGFIWWLGSPFRSRTNYYAPSGGVSSGTTLPKSTTPGTTSTPKSTTPSTDSTSSPGIKGTSPWGGSSSSSSSVSGGSGISSGAKGGIGSSGSSSSS
jgi:hypothetical protein